MELFQSPYRFAFIFPVFALAIVIEALLYQRQKGRPYPWKDSVVSFVIAAGHNVTGIINHTVIFAIFALTVWHYRIVTVPMTAWWAIPSLFLLEEFAYYWYHRCAHRIRFLWATHSVHHSPEELTLSAAYRLGWTPILSGSYLFFLPIVWLGYDPAWVFGLLGLSLLYQFWLHSTLIPKLGPLEWVLNTPSAHRVHHASNEEYLDRNYGGILIVFDRLFGTYVEEDDRIEIRYGLVHPVTSRNPFKVVFGEFWNMAKDTWAATSWADRARTLLMPPGWTPKVQPRS
jgi:sterol desaturase/sphingolipid hydroxylase (fatty acid hydroxylase superfamily)